MSSTYTHTNRDMSKSRRILKALSFLYFIGVVLAVVYICFFAHDRYLSESSFKISREKSGAGYDSGMMELALPGMSESGSMDSQVTIGYIQSIGLLEHLEQKFNLVEHYSAPKADFVFRLDADAPLETRLDYYRKHIVPRFDVDTGLTLLTVDAYDPELSQKVAAEALMKAEDFVNTIDQSIAQQQLSFAEKQLDHAQSKVVAAHKELLELQNKHQLISPDEMVSARLAAVQVMQVDKLKTKAELSTLMRDSPESPAIGNLQSRLLSLQELIDSEMAQLSGTERDRLNQVLMEFQELELKLDFVTRLRSSAELLLEQNRVKAGANTRFFSIIQSPHLPEDATKPERFYVSVTLVVLSLLLFLVLRALTFSVFERN